MVFADVFSYFNNISRYGINISHSIAHFPKGIYTCISNTLKTNYESKNYGLKCSSLCIVFFFKLNYIYIVCVCRHNNIECGKRGTF